MNSPPYATELGLQLCHDCGNVCPLDDLECSRCWSALHMRKPNSINRTWAFLTAALVLYIPANLLPVMYTGVLDTGSESTILRGVVDFWQGGSWDIAALIFIASVGVPCIKFFVLGVLLITVQRSSTWAMLERARLYRFVELTGYWSMLDVLVVALVAALVQLRALSTVEPRSGILFFGLVVVLTMMASMSFDPRLIWDAEKSDVRKFE